MRSGSTCRNPLDRHPHAGRLGAAARAVLPALLALISSLAVIGGGGGAGGIGGGGGSAAFAAGPPAAGTPPSPGPAVALPFAAERWGPLRWREVGPYRGGRSAAVTGVPGDRSTYYFGGTGGGVWKSSDAGRTWRNVSDGSFGGSIGAVAVSAWDPNVVYAGTGEETVRGNVSEGDGMWKSTDAGRTWKRAGLADSRHITRIRIHPRNPDLVYAAVLGHLFGPNAERGVFRSTDGGATWKKVLYVNDQVGAVDLAMDPGNPRVLYATTWRIRRTPYSLESGGLGSGLWKSTDGGDTWSDLSRNPGLPKGTLGIVGVSPSPSDPENVYAIVEAAGGGVFRSRDGGKTWKRTSTDHELTQRAWYYNRIFADPADPETVYVVNVFFLRSKDGGRTFSPIRVPHGDNHDLWIDPADPRRMIESNDGGANVSEDAGRSWTAQDNQPTAQIYRVAADNHFPYRLYGAQQDNSALRIASRGEAGAIGPRDWQVTAGGESGYILPDPRNADVVYGGSYGGLLLRVDHATGEIRDINPWPDDPMGAGAADLAYRFQWNFPIALSPHDPRVLYVGAQVMFRSADEGQTWATISPDLTRNDKGRQGPSGGPITKDNTSVEYYDTVFAIAESPVKAGVIWAGSDDGLVHVTADGGAHWQDVTPAAGLPAWSQINCIEPSPFDAGGAYLAATRYKSDDQHPYLFKTADYGRHWTAIDGGIDAAHFTRAVRADPARRGLLYAGTQRGVYVSWDDGGSWQPLQLNLPVVPVTDLLVKDGDLVAATEGRGFWILDDLEPLRELAAGPGSAVVLPPLHLFTPRPAYRLAENGGDGGDGDAPPGQGANPPGGLVIDYYLRDAPAAGQAPLKIEVLDAGGKLVRTFTAAKPEEGKGGEKGAEKAGGQAAGKAGEKVGGRAGSAKAAARDAGKGSGQPAGTPAASEAGGAAQPPATPAGAVERAAESEEAGAAEEPGGENEEPGFNREPKEPQPPAAQGFNRFVWDLSYPRAKGFPGMVLWHGGLIAPRVVPGSYQVRVTAAGQSAAAATTVLADPRSHTSGADLAAQQGFLLGIRDKLDATHDALRRLRAVRAQLTDLGKRLKEASEEAGAAAGSPEAGPGAAASSGTTAGGPAAVGAGGAMGADRYTAVRQAAKALDTKLAAVEDALYQSKSKSAEDMLNYPIRLDDKLNGVAQSASLGDYPPTAQAIRVRDQLVAAIDEQLAKLAAILDHDVAAFNQTAAAAGVQAVIPPRTQIK